MVNKVKLDMLKLVPKLKTNKSLKLLLVNMKANSSILTRWKGCQKTSNNALLSLWSLELE